mmetsp:Transcript_4488/g.6377  ORF Transcript_4488/g.6377 Transcript_4488/m.6377 type:complete len:332 (+) Transcript_4488:221-1216(+)
MVSVLIILTLSPVRGPGPRASRIDAIGETWGKRAIHSQRAKVAVLIDGQNENAAATKEACLDHDLISWDLPSSKDQKFSQAKAMAYAFERAATLDFDWVLWGNDHTFLIVHRLLSYLDNKLDHTKLMYVGSRLYGPCCGVFNSGAAGFLLSKPAINLLTTQWRDPKNVACDLNNKRNHIAVCLKLFDIVPLDTRDDQGLERFHIYGPIRLATGAIDHWYLTKKLRLTHPNSPLSKDEGETYQALKFNLSKVSPSVISFHYVSGHEALLLDSLIHNSHPNISPPYSDKADALASLWPKQPHLGGYAHPFPSRSKIRSSLVVHLLDSIRLGGD